MANDFLDDLIFRINTAKENGQLSDPAKLILWGDMLQAAGFGRITLGNVTELEILMDLDTKKYWKAFEVATFGKEQNN
jgi:hypothetical protein